MRKYVLNEAGKAEFQAGAAPPSLPRPGSRLLSTWKLQMQPPRLEFIPAKRETSTCRASPTGIYIPWPWLCPAPWIQGRIPAKPRPLQQFQEGKTHPRERDTTDLRGGKRSFGREGSSRGKQEKSRQENSGKIWRPGLAPGENLHELSEFPTPSLQNGENMDAQTAKKLHFDLILPL